MVFISWMGYKTFRISELALCLARMFVIIGFACMPTSIRYNYGDQNLLIPQLWPSRHFDPRMVGIEALDPQDHGIKSRLRDTLIPQCWGSKDSDPAAVAFASV